MSDPLLNSLSQLTLLYVEDDVATREELAFFLEGLVSELFLAANGQEGFDLYCSKQPDIIITDIQMPIVNGIEMIEKIRAIDNNTPILITSAYNETDYLLNAINIGVDRYILKPISLQLLTEALKECAQSTKSYHFLLSINQEGLIVDINLASLKLMGYEKEEILDTPIIRYIDSAHISHLEQYLTRLRNKERIETFKLTLVHKNGMKIETRFHILEQLHGMIKIEFKDIDTYINNEMVLTKMLELERFTKELIYVQSKINEIIITTPSRTAFLEKIVTLFSDIDHFSYAYIATIEDGKLHLLAQSSHHLLDAKKIYNEHRTQIHHQTHCPIFESIVGQKIIVIEDLHTFQTCNMHTPFTVQGIQSMIILPIRQREAQSAFGALNLLFTKVFKLEQETLRQFENISDLIALGLQSIDDKHAKHALAMQLRQERDFMNNILENAGVIILVLNKEGAIIRFNKKAEEFTGYSATEVIGKPYFWKNFIPNEEKENVIGYFKEMLHLHETRYHENHWLSRSGEKRLFHWTNTRLSDEKDEMQYIVAIGNDITERKQNEETIKHLAFYDPLTQLPNRRLLKDRLNKAMAMSKRTNYYGALMFLDLDNFKTLNDTYGHTIGDLLLMEAANRIKYCVRETDSVARFGGDEFIVLLTEINSNVNEAHSQARLVAEKVRHVLAQPYIIQHHQDDGTTLNITHECTSSVGIALFRGHDVTQDELLRRADSAMYEAKKAGRNQLSFYM